ncbi:MAG TPA: DUF1569 domain-containing protein [Leptospiraceae bacterium]|nr:DUF1569 domain-containing protein [Leptospiraceae bacterium]HMY66253.1 DUF1569 domain-containing protein [Leptospiraceae bacterium]HMZ59975.1 DUF1569 domain-containing protein [Leptospiraceae bacterium]HNF16709.1 DUF1569 domain-containing protein [Leptospiraceae bacterium]HNF22966.1 DUF1569 domain-containing protein [Leptospiraceae bacterium]
MDRKNKNLSRSDFLLGSIGTVILADSSLHCASGDIKLVRDVKLASLDEALKELQKLEKAKRVFVPGLWNLNQVLAHCAQSIEYSITGYPKNKSVIIRKTVGKLVLMAFLSKGKMSHNLNDPIPGAPSLPTKEDYFEGLDRLKAAIQKFKEAKEPLAPHFVYDALSKADYDRVHAMHIADHLSAVELRDEY